MPILINSPEQAQEVISKNKIMSLINEIDIDGRREMRKDQWFMDRYSLWHSSSIRSERRIGSLMKLIESCNPQSLEDWINYYFSEQQGYSSFYQLILEGMQVLRLSFEAAAYYIWIHVIDFAWDGYQAESKALERLSEQYPHLSFKRASEKEDKSYGLDFTVWDGGKLVGAVQVKGFKYFIGKKAKERMMKHTSGYSRWLNKTGTRIMYLLNETLERDDELVLFPTYCFGDESAPDYPQIISCLMPEVQRKYVVKI